MGISSAIKNLNKSASLGSRAAEAKQGAMSVINNMQSGYNASSESSGGFISSFQNSNTVETFDVQSDSQKLSQKLASSVSKIKDVKSISEKIGNDKEYVFQAKRVSTKTSSIKKFDYAKAADLSKSAKVIKNDDSTDLSVQYSIFADLLKNTKYKDLAGFNRHIKDSVKEAGFGTLNGVLTAINTLAYDYPEATNYKYFYTKNFDATMREGTDGIAAGKTNLDCRAFVQWALYNGGYNADIVQYRSSFQNWGEENGLVMDDIYSAKAGDIFSGDDNGGHIWMVVDKYDDGYYVAEEYGYENGLVINKRDFNDFLAEVEKYNAKGYDMSGFYSNVENIRTVNS